MPVLRAKIGALSKTQRNKQPATKNTLNYSFLSKHTTFFCLILQKKRLKILSNSMQLKVQRKDIDKQASGVKSDFQPDEAQKMVFGSCLRQKKYFCQKKLQACAKI